MPDYPVGGHPCRSGAVLEAYAETDALDHLCPNCRAAVGEFCIHDDGTQRKIPCPKRLRAQEES
jgi:hypothetical protein